jgi:hypothetical protein
MTTTVTTTISSVMATGFGAAIALVVIVLVIGLLFAKETMSSVPDTRARAVGRLLNVGAFPLLIAFAAIILMKLLPMFVSGS